MFFFKHKNGEKKTQQFLFIYIYIIILILYTIVKKERKRKQNAITKYIINKTIIPLYKFKWLLFETLNSLHSSNGKIIFKNYLNIFVLNIPFFWLVRCCILSIVRFFYCCIPLTVRFVKCCISSIIVNKLVTTRILNSKLYIFFNLKKKCHLFQTKPQQYIRKRSRKGISRCHSLTIDKNLK